MRHPNEYAGCGMTQWIKNTTPTNAHSVNVTVDNESFEKDK